MSRVASLSATLERVTPAGGSVGTLPARRLQPAVRPLFSTASDAKGAMEREVAEARTLAEARGYQDGQAKLATITNRYREAIGQLRQAARSAACPLAGEVVDLALQVAKALLERELATDREFIVRTLEQALQSVATEDAIVVRVSPHDLASIREARPDLIDGAGMTLLPDEKISQGGCTVESARRVVDATIEGRLDAARDALNAIIHQSIRSDEHTPDASEEPPADAE